MSRRIPGLACSLALTLAAAGCGAGGSDTRAQETRASAPGCEYVPSPPPRSAGRQRPPTRQLAAKVYDLVVRTNCGTFTVRVDQASAPAAAASVVKLARRGFYDGTVFHRIVPGFVIQGGDPTGTGYGGAGYTTVDPPAKTAAYRFGTVAMSKTASARAGTASSQFFIVTAADAKLNAENAILGHVVRGKDVIRRIGRLGDRSGRPSQTVVIRSMRVVERAAASPTTTTVTQPPPPTTTGGETVGGCRSVTRPAPRPGGGHEPPKTSLNPSHTYDAVVDTTCGRFVVRLDVRTSPKTTASFTALARARFYDDTYFHRIAPGWIFQGGDPTGTGNGGPGYQTVEPPPSSTRYTKGVVAMAKTPTAKAGTAGSQFFVVTADDARLPAQYALLGRVVSGLKVVERIGALGNATTQQPTRYVVIERIAIRER